MNDSAIELRTLGPVELKDADGAEISEVLHQPKRLALLVHLAVASPGSFQSRDTLLALFWPDLPEKRARNALNKSVHFLRIHLGSDVVVSRGATDLGLAPERLWCDAVALEVAVEEERFETAEELWRGPFLEGFHVPDADEVEFWLERQRERLERLRGKALASLARSAVVVDDHASAVLWWRRVVEHDRFDSRAVLRLMESLEAVGKRGEALRAADELALRLSTELDAEPDPEVERFAARLREAPRPMAAAAVSEPRHNLPAPPTPFIGRKEELNRLGGLLADPGARLVTLTGPGGVGKTRIAIEVGRGAVERFPDGVFFVVLGPLRDPDLVGATIARTLDLETSGPRSVEEELVAAFQERRCLLILDSFERVLPAAGLVAELLRESEEPKAIVTSRSILHLRGEHVLPVPPLRAPPDVRGLSPEEVQGYEAVDLFVQRARAARPDFSLTEENHEAVGEVCYHLDGLPLAIELAAARVRLLSPSMIRDRLSNRFELLTGGPRDLPERHQKLRATFDWSYDLLSEGERRLFRRLCVFVGGCSLEGIQRVCDPEGREGEILDELATLVDVSLLSRVESVDEEPRFETLESIREYGWELAEQEGETDEQRRLHARYYLELAERLEPELAGPRQEVWLDRLAQEHHNIQAVLDWALEHGDLELAVQLGSALWWFWWVRGHFTEMRRRLDRALAERGRLSPSLQANLLVASGSLASMEGDHERALAHFQEAFAAERGAVGRREVVRALRSMAFALSQRGEYDRAVALLEESHELARELESPSDVSAGLRGLAKMRLHQRGYEEAERLYREALEIDRERGDRQSMAWSLAGLGEVARHREEMDEAARLLEEGLALCRELDSKPGIAYLLLASGHVSRYSGEVEEAEARYREALPLLRDLRNRRRIALCLLGLAAVAARKEEWSRALLLFGAVEPMLEPMGIQIAPVDEGELRMAEKRIRENLTEEEIEKLRRRGCDMELEEAIDFGLFGEASV